MLVCADSVRRRREQLVASRRMGGMILGALARTPRTRRLYWSLIDCDTRKTMLTALPLLRTTQARSHDFSMSDAIKDLERTSGLHGTRISPTSVADVK